LTIPSKIAEQLAAASPSHKTTLIDTFAGVGGNTIAFALSGRWDKIFAVEKDPATLACAKHNAKIYGVEDKIWWVSDDIFSALKKRLSPVIKDAVIFGSPPWGGKMVRKLIDKTSSDGTLGPTYTTLPIFDLSLMAPYSLKDLYDAFTRKTSDVVLFLPRNSDLRQVAEYVVNEHRQLKVIHYCMYGASKALCVFFGDFKLEE
jgi:trimethylguanosine synthase